MRVLLVISYDGTNYCGWQRQLNGVSVQEVIETSIFKLTGEKVSLTASGRTDAGVHAEAQVAHFDTNSNIPGDKFFYAINTFLPDDIRIISSKTVEQDFHARYFAKKKTYEYSFYVSPIKLPLKERFSTRVDGFDLSKAQKALDVIVGKHDFKCFLASGSEIKTTVRTIYQAKAYYENGFYKIMVTGNGFLYNMVRIIAGTVLGVIEDKILIEDIKQALLNGDRNLLGKTAPSKGLTLKSVEYI